MQEWSKPLTLQNLCMGSTPFAHNTFNSSVDFIQVSVTPSPALALLFCMNFSRLLTTSANKLLSC